MINDKMLLDALHQAGHTGAAKVELSAGNDWSGDPAFHIRIGMDAAIPVEELTFEFLQSLQNWVQNWVEEQEGDARYPYVRIYSLSEIEAHAAS